MTRQLGAPAAHAARAFVGTTVTVLTLFAVGYLAGPERFGIFSILQYAPYPVVLFPAVLALLASVLLDWRWRAAAAFGLVLVPTALMGATFGLGGGDEGTHVRVMTFNVKDYVTFDRPGGLSGIFGEISRVNPDVLMLQDARQLTWLLRDDPVAGRGFFDGRHTFAFGQYVVASRFPLQDCATGDISFRGETHTYVRCRIDAPDGAFDVATAHFMTPRFGLAATRLNPLSGITEWTRNVEDRVIQARRLADDLRLRPRPLILAGDLNAPDSSLVVRALTDRGLRDAFRVGGRGFGYTWGHSLPWGVPFLRIDHILVSPEFVVQAAFTGEPADSAHRPVIADVHLASAAR